jgi:hypothetical protein
MRLQLTTAQLTSMGAKLGPYTLKEPFVASILDLFLKEGHDPFTRRDISALLHNASGDLDSDYGEIPYPKVEGQRGYYTFGKPAAPEAMPESPAAPVAAPVTTAPAVALLPAPAPSVATPWSPAVDTESYYAEDVGLRRLAASQTKCFGSYMAEATPCEACPLAAFCAPLSLASLASIAATLDRDTMDAIRSGKKAGAPRAVAVEPEPEAVEPLIDGVYEYPPDTHFTPTPFDGVCTKCRKSVPEGTRAAHITGRGMLHEHCARLPRS